MKIDWNKHRLNFILQFENKLDDIIINYDQLALKEDYV